MPGTRYPVRTIGHSTHSIEDLIALLKGHSVTVIADVRSVPYSRYNPQYNRETLQQSLKERGIGYVFLGDALGARTSDPVCYEDGRIRFERVVRTTVFQRGIERILEGSREHWIALMCAEREPLDCHRTILVSPVLVSRGMRAEHILADGRLESHDKTIKRLLSQYGLEEEDLFRTYEERVIDALRRQEARMTGGGRKTRLDE